MVEYLTSSEGEIDKSRLVDRDWDVPSSVRVSSDVNNVF
jgi:hypothetical protein